MEFLKPADGAAKVGAGPVGLVVGLWVGQDVVDGTANVCACHEPLAKIAEGGAGPDDAFVAPIDFTDQEVLMQARLRRFSVLVGAHQESAHRTVVPTGGEMVAGHFHLEGDIFEVGAPTAVNAAPLSEELAGVIAVEPLGLDLDDADFIGRQFEDVDPDEFVARHQSCLKDHGLARIEPLLCAGEGVVRPPLGAILTCRVVQFCQCPHLVTAVGERLHEGVRLIGVVVLLRVEGVLQLSWAGQCDFEPRFSEVSQV